MKHISSSHGFSRFPSPLPLLHFPTFPLTYLSTQLDEVMLELLGQQSCISHACVFVISTLAKESH